MSALGDEPYLSLATFRKSGVAVETAVWCAESDGRLWVFSAGDAGKVKRLRNSSRARVAPCDMRGRLGGDWVDATAHLVDDVDAITRAHAAMRRKYGWQMRLGDFFAGLSGRKDRRAWIAIDL